MAARKSCTKMTWSEAKNKCGVGGGSKNPNKASLKLSSQQQPNHGKLLAAKIIAKQGPGEDTRIKNRQAAKTARKDQIRQEQLDRRKELEKEQKKLDEMVRPCETALVKLKEVETKFHEKEKEATHHENENENSESSADDPDRRNILCESKQLQVDEVLALEAIYADQDILKVSAASRLDELQEKLEAWQEDPDNLHPADAVIRHPSISYTFTRSIDDPDDEDFVAHLLMHVVYPSDYPLLTTPPKIKILWHLVTKRSLVVPSNKPLENFGILDEVGLLEHMSEEAQESLLGMPSVYELLEAWMGEHLFEFLQKR